MLSDIKIIGPVNDYVKESILSDEAINFIMYLHRRFNLKRKHLLQERVNQQRVWDQGKQPEFLEDTHSIISSDWQVTDTPQDLLDRRVEITGPVDRKMMINALNSGAKVFMADLEDSCAPSWQNIIKGHDNLNLAVRRSIDFTSKEGKNYKLNKDTATLIVRPRGWHLEESQIIIDGKAVSASLFDVGLYLFHNAKESLKAQTGPYLYLPKLESSAEASLWADVLDGASSYLSLPPSTIKVTVLIETITAAYQMEEILYALKDYIVGMNAGRWDYIFSVIKRFGKHSNNILPNRDQITMAVPFMRAYTERLVKICHKRGAHAIGGMSAFIPNRKDPDLSRHAIEKVKQDKEREVNDGFDGTWVAHPDLVPVAMEIFDNVLKGNSHQKHIKRQEVDVTAKDLLNTNLDGSYISKEGVRSNISIALQYINCWLEGSGAVAINNLMEDAATAEISRAQLWQWIKHNCKLDDGSTVSEKLYRSIRGEEKLKLTDLHGARNYETAANLLDQLVLSDEFSEFLTLPAYLKLDHQTLTI